MKEISTVNTKKSKKVQNIDQMDLFAGFLCNTEKERDMLSNTIDIWDSLSRYSATATEMNRLRTNNIYLPSLEFDFNHKGQSYKVKIQPALIEDEDGIERAYYPSASEELVEDVLRKLATEKDCGFFNLEKNYCGVYFTIRQVMLELNKRKKTRSHAEVVRSLKILSRSHIEITLANGKGVSNSSYLPSLTAISKEAYESDPKAKWVAHFHPLVMESINLLTYRQYNYAIMMSLKSQLSRWIHKRLSHSFTNASLMQPYKMLLSTIEEESKLLMIQKVNGKIRKVERCLEELKAKNVITHFTREDRSIGLRKIKDILFVLHPHQEFVRDVKASNKRTSNIRELLE